ncbi:MAG: SDR family NAD(P)-dependent oxidoreductase [Acetobacteraceae bacterium]|nr:SDR family NAD(P)-dependent oxidoreductase [Acetobacteraceae bacterium]
MRHFASVLVTGASSGIGRAIALQCARPGAVLHLTGRDLGRLEATASAGRARGAEVKAAIVDVRDAEAMAAWIGEAGPLDVVIANAGVSSGTGDGVPETHEQARVVFATNLDGVLNTAFPAMEAMARQPTGPDGVRGRIAVIASIAAFVPAPGAPSYCASKAAVDAWTVATAPIARRRGVQLTSVCPGYVRTPMTAGNRFRMPGLMDPDRLARVALASIAAGRVRVVYPGWLGAAARLVGLLPPRWSGALLSTQPGKDPEPRT